MSTLAAVLATTGFLVSFGLQGCGNGATTTTSTTTTTTSTTTTTVAAKTTTTTSTIAPLEKVKVEFWGESGDQYTSKFITDSLDTAAKAENIEQIMDFQMFPFGNAYYITELCGGDSTSYSWTNMSTYSSVVRDCFNKKCGPGGGDSVKCYEDGPYCQHGESECAVNRLQMCSQKIIGYDKFVDYVPFVSCFQGQYEYIRKLHSTKGLVPDFKVITDVMDKCKKSVPGGFSDEIWMCLYIKNTTAATEVHLAQVTVHHDVLPLVRVTNKTGKPFALQLGDLDKITKDTLLQAVCDAWVFNGGNRSVVPQCVPAITTTTTTPKKMIIAV